MKAKNNNSMIQNLGLILIVGLIGISSFSVKDISGSSIEGRIIEQQTGKPLMNVRVVLLKESQVLDSTNSGINGMYKFDNVDVGSFNILFRKTGFQQKKVSNIVVQNNHTARVDITLVNLQLTEIPIVILDSEPDDTESMEETLLEQSYSTTISDESKIRYKKDKIKTSNNREIRQYEISSGAYQGEGTSINTGTRQNQKVSKRYIDPIYNPVPPPIKPPYHPQPYYEPNPSESYAEITENTFLSALHDPLSTFSIDVDAASYSNSRRFINQGQLPPRDAVRIEEYINYFSYDYIQPEDKHPFSINMETAKCPWNEDHKLVHIGIQGMEVEKQDIPANNLVFLIDVSGSMAASNKLPLLKQGMKMLVKQLRSKDRVAIVTYAGRAEVALSSTSGRDKDKIIEAINKLQSGGSTAGASGIKLAYEIADENFKLKGINRIILATDGDFNVGISSENELEKLVERKRRTGIFLTVLGFGMGNYKDSKLEILADKGNGNYAYIDNMLEAKKVLVTEFSSTVYTIAKDVKIQVEFNPTLVQGYRLIGYENRMLAAEDFNDDTKDAGELGAGHTVTALYEIIPTGIEVDKHLDFPDIDALKYQRNQLDPMASKELVTVKLRYKKPRENDSQLIEVASLDSDKSVEEASNNLKFSGAVALFGMILRDSEFVEHVDYSDVIALAKSSKGEDMDGYRGEFIRLVEQCELIDTRTVVTSKKRNKKAK